MLFGIIRLAIGSIVFVLNLFLFKRFHKIHKNRWTVISFLIAVIFTTIFSMVPMEDALVTFSSAESAFGYNHSGNVKLVLDGEKTSFVVGEKSETDIYVIVPKANNGWKIGMGLNTKKIIHTITDGITIYVYQYKNTNDYFITVLDTNGGISKISDSCNSEFKYLENYNTTLKKTFYTYYAYINHFDNQYVLTVNDRTIQIQY